jgi:hypothetical protein
MASILLYIDERIKPSANVAVAASTVIRAYSVTRLSSRLDA